MSYSRAHPGKYSLWIDYEVHTLKSGAALAGADGVQLFIG